MTVPVSYTPQVFRQWLHGFVTNARLDELLGWSPANEGAYDEIITDALLALGETALSDVTDMPVLRAVGRVLLWRKVLEGLALLYTVSQDTGTFNRDRIITNVERLLALAVQDANRVGGLAAAVASPPEVTVPDATVQPVSDPYDPYAPGSLAWYPRRHRTYP